MGRVKERMMFLDTHILVWLYDDVLSAFTQKALKLLEDNSLYVSPIVKLELQYLFEIGKIKNTPITIISELSRSIGLQLSLHEFLDVINQAVAVTWTRDPFDRIITADAMFGNCKLLTADRNILQQYKLAVW